MTTYYAVFGAGGKTGRECVKALLARGDGARAVVRDPAKYDGAWGDAAGGKLEVSGGRDKRGKGEGWMDVEKTDSKA